MGELILSIGWCLWGVACFVSGAYLLGPTIYSRQLRRALRQHRHGRTPIDHDGVRRLIEEVTGVDPGQ